jgi:hypothetical protein
MTTYDIYRQVALDSIKCYNNLEFLCYAWQTAHLDISYPSWVPRWDHDTSVENSDNLNSSPLLPFLYNTAGGTFPRLQTILSESTLHVQGLSLGQVLDTDTVLRIRGERGPTDYSGGEDSISEHLMTMSRILVQDRWQDIPGAENTARRAHKNLRAHFADFCACLLPLLKMHEKDSYIPFYSTWCTVCKSFIGEGRKPTLNLSKVYNCQICDSGDYDLCTNCYNEGKRCKDPKHDLKSTTVTSFWCPYTQEIIGELEANANMGNGNRFFEIARSACFYRAFLRTSQGWKGVASQVVESGDMLVVLFGSRVPFILRRHGIFYRLVSDCYIHGLMNGEAIQMWESGELKVKDFMIK